MKTIYLFTCSIEALPIMDCDLVIEDVEDIWVSVNLLDNADVTVETC